METIARWRWRSALLVCLFAPLWACLAEVPRSAAELKAVFLFNFASYAEWPVSSSLEGQPFRIGVAGAPEVADALEKVIAGERIRGQSVQIIRVRLLSDAASCHVLYLAAGEESTLSPELMRRPILTVGDSDRFEQLGGAIRFLSERNRIRLRISPEDARRVGLRINAQLLRIAEIREKSR